MGKKITKGWKTKIGYAEQLETGFPTTFTDIARITAIGGIPQPEADDIETSNMDSVNAWKTFTAGWADAGQCELNMQFHKDDAAVVWGLFRQDKAFRIEFVDGSKWLFNGYVKKFGNEVEREGLVTVTLTMKVSGEPEFAVAAAAVA
ncbi:MAG TPA: phage tail tube protein [Tepidisphaeraceae bacterium]|nr:phage tail tube protein [Tepidisphaeraceae bacterium]